MTRGLGLKVSASCNARFTWRCSIGACSGPNDTTMRWAALAAPRSLTPLTESAPRSLVRVSPPTWRFLNPGEPGNGSRLAKRMYWPALARMPVRRSSSRHSAWRSDSPERATESSAGVCSGSEASSTGFTDGAGTASTLNGPVTRFLPVSTNGWSYSVSSGACRAIARVDLGLGHALL